MITSVRNPHVLELARLARRRVRKQRGLHLVEGPHAVAEAVTAGVVVEVLTTDPAGVAASLGVDPVGTPVTGVSDDVLARLADSKTPQGVVAVARTPVHTLADALAGRLAVVLLAVADPGNAGTVIRTADAAGAAGVVLTDGSVDPFGPKALRAAAGSTYHLPVVTGVTVDDVVDACRRSGVRLAVLDGAGPGSVFDLEGSDAPLALALGNEAHGVDPQVRDAADEVVAVPIAGRAESLNVAAAAAVAVYAAARRRSGW